MKPTEVTLTMDYKFQQLLIETDIGYILVDLLQDKYPAHDGLQKETGSMIEVKRKDLLDAVKIAVDAGAKNITLVFDNNNVVIEAPKIKKQEVAADPDHKKFTATAKVAANALLEALKAVSTTKILMFFPAAAAHSLIIDTVTGVMYVFAVTGKVAAQLVESAADALKKPEPQREVVETGTNHDGTPYVLEAVEQSPLEEVLSIEEREKKREELAQKYGSDKLELAEAVDTVTKLREKIKQIVKDIDSEITQIQEQQTNAVKQVNANPNFKDFAQQQDKPLAKYHQQLEELQLLKEKLTQVVTEAENAESVLENYTHVYTLTIEKLKEISLKMLWWGGRTIEFLFKEEKTWFIEMKIIEPQRR
jgi:DNA repair exonuclease SbcCD ATPase subunit